MSSQKTEHYQLHKWEPGDVFLREEFNENFGAIDGALGAHDGVLAGKAERSEVKAALGSLNGTLAAHAQAIAQKADGAAMTVALAQVNQRVDGKADGAATAAALAKKCEVHLGSYTGSGNRDGTWQDISLGYRPQAVLVCSRGGANGLQLDYIFVQLATTDQTADCLEVTDGGFRVRGSLCYDWNSRSPYVFLAFV